WDAPLQSSAPIADATVMPTLKAHQPYNLRRHGNKYLPVRQKRKRRNLTRFIPEADSDFACVANTFSRSIQANPAPYGISLEGAAEIAEAVRSFRSALAVVTSKATRTPVATREKQDARARCEAVIRRYASMIRANPEVT